MEARLYSDRQKIAVNDKGSHFQALFQDVFADYQNPPLTGNVKIANKAWNIWKKTLPLTGGSASLISLSGAPLRVWCFIRGSPSS